MLMPSLSIIFFSSCSSVLHSESFIYFYHLLPVHSAVGPSLFLPLSPVLSLSGSICHSFAFLPLLLSTLKPGSTGEQGKENQTKMRTGHISVDTHKHANPGNTGVFLAAPNGEPLWKHAHTHRHTLAFIQTIRRRVGTFWPNDEHGTEKLSIGGRGKAIFSQASIRVFKNAPVFSVKPPKKKKKRLKDPPTSLTKRTCGIERDVEM